MIKRIPVPLVILVCFLVAALALLALWVGTATGQEALPHELEPDFPLIAVYPNGNTDSDPANYWAIRLTVHWDNSSFYWHPDRGECDPPACKWVITGSAEELPGAVLIFVSNGVDNHGSAAWIYLPD